MKIIQGKKKRIPLILRNVVEEKKEAAVERRKKFQRFITE
jgi:hypothetical protein